MVLVDGAGTPLGVHLDSASPQEITLLKTTLENVSVRRSHRPGRPRMKPERLVLDRGYDSNPLRGWLESIGIEPIIPATRAHPYATHQDGRKLRRYRHRWIVERTFAWLGWFRRLLIRHERLLTTYTAFFHVACAMIVLKRVLQ
jgi:transposase